MEPPQFDTVHVRMFQSVNFGVWLEVREGVRGMGLREVGGWCGWSLGESIYAQVKGEEKWEMG